MNPSSNQTAHYTKQAYIFINLILFAPILLWPVPAFIFENPMLTELVISKWILSITILLFVSIGMDSLLYGIRNQKQAIMTVLWVSLASLLIMQNQQNIWLLALLFLAHSFRSALPLFQPQKVKLWWLNIAWYRDIASAISIFLWLNIVT